MVSMLLEKVWEKRRPVAGSAVSTAKKRLNTLVALQPYPLRPAVHRGPAESSEIASAPKMGEGDGGFPCSACFVVDDGKSLSVVFDAHPSKAPRGFTVDPDLNFFHFCHLGIAGRGRW